MADIDFPTYAATTEGSDAITAVTGPLYATAAQGALADSASQATGVENNADVTDTANVTAAGALMDSEVTNLAAVKAFDPTDYATAAQGATADAAVEAVSTVTKINGPITQAAYDLLTPDADTLYVIVG